MYFLFFPRVPFLDQQFLEYAMEIDPSEKMCGKGTIEKKVWIVMPLFGLKKFLFKFESFVVVPRFLGRPLMTRRTPTSPLKCCGGRRSSSQTELDTDGIYCCAALMYF